MASKLGLFLSDLRRRKVTRVAVVYAVVGAGTAEAAQLLFEAFELPFAGWQVLVALILLGFPVVLVFAWALDLTPSGVRRTEPATDLELAQHRTAGWRSVAGWGLAAFFLCVTAWQALGAGDATARALGAVDRINQALEARDYLAAYQLAGALPTSLPDSTRDRLWLSVTASRTLASEPAGATVSWNPSFGSGDAWVPLGEAPVQVDLPRRGVFAVRFELTGHVPRVVLGGTTISGAEIPFPVVGLRRENEAFPDGLHVSGGEVSLGAYGASSFRGVPPATVGDYLLDKHEVTNAQYQEFVEADGYGRPELWEHSFVDDGRGLDWEEAMARFVDRTGRPGPATWEIGEFPSGQGQFPVTGLSWYEAAAYARFAGRSLPTAYHWYRAAGANASDLIIPLSNLGSRGPAPVGDFRAISSVGAADMAGNAREWLANSSGDLRYTAGGGWNDPDYLFYMAQPQRPFDRSGTNGFRLITNLGDPALFVQAGGPLDRTVVDYTLTTPVDDGMFSAFLAMYSFDDRPLEARVERVDTLDIGTRERVTFWAAYGDERVVLYVFLPERRAPPFQTVLYFPGAGALNQSNIDLWSARAGHVSFLLRSGRAVAFPVFKSTFEREDDWDGVARPDNETRDRVIQWSQDVGRSIGYLRTRPDIDMSRLAYFGYSWGGQIAPIMLTTHPVFRTAVLYVAGLTSFDTHDAVRPFHFAPRVRTPVLMLSGEHDNVFPLETSARPFFELLGSEEKVHYVAPGGHFVPGHELISETLSWLDEHLGETR